MAGPYGIPWWKLALAGVLGIAAPVGLGAYTTLKLREKKWGAASTAAVTGAVAAAALVAGTLGSNALLAPYFPAGTMPPDASGATTGLGGPLYLPAGGGMPSALTAHSGAAKVGLIDVARSMGRVRRWR